MYNNKDLRIEQRIMASTPRSPIKKSDMASVGHSRKHSNIKHDRLAHTNTKETDIDTFNKDTDIFEARNFNCDTFSQDIPMILNNLNQGSLPTQRSSTS